MCQLHAYGTVRAPRYSWNMRTARSRTFGEKRFDLVMASSSEKLEHLKNTGASKDCTACFDILLYNLFKKYVSGQQKFSTTQLLKLLGRTH